MPNIEQLINLRRKFRGTYKLIEDYNFFDDKIKYFNSNLFNDNNDELKNYLISWFINGIEEKVVLLFIDITSFSKLTCTLKNIEISEFLSKYYDSSVKIIYQNQGEIEKIMGDGIVSIFGKPFVESELPECIKNAEKCAEELVNHFYNTNYNIKVAIHIGSIKYCRIDFDEYTEFMAIGQSMTELFRLESVSKNNAINYFLDSEYGELNSHEYLFEGKNFYYSDKSVNLKGIPHKKIRSIQLLQL